MPKLDTATQSATKLPIDVTHSLVRAPMRCLTASTETDSTSLKLHPKYRGTWWRVIRRCCVRMPSEPASQLLQTSSK